ncbi:hypothetical protein glysoja_014484 [Glycine soja]|nr:hypothetical protein glysoja_014484 [Glycine soja]
MKNRYLVPERRWFVGLAVVGLIGAVLFLSNAIRTSETSYVCPGALGIRSKTRTEFSYDASPIQLRAIMHYATSRVVPQQSVSEIKISLDVIKSLGRPINFLVTGLGHDSLMWASFNPGGTTVFLEEDPNYATRRGFSPRTAPNLRVLPRRHTCEATKPESWRRRIFPTSFTRQSGTPKGYFAEVPGRMAAVFSAAVMARNRKGSGVTHVFLHDVDRKVEKVYAEEFLCKKNLVKGVGRLWHFEIPPSNDTRTWTLQDTTNQITVLHGIITTDSPAATTTSSPREVSWFAPPDNAFKLNVAGAHLASNPGPSGFWGLLRNNSAEWITGFSGYCGHATNLYAELMTILQGLLLVWEKGIRLLICESDSS